MKILFHLTTSQLIFNVPIYNDKKNIQKTTPLYDDDDANNNNNTIWSLDIFHVSNTNTPNIHTHIKNAHLLLYTQQQKKIVKLYISVHFSLDEIILS